MTPPAEFNWDSPGRNPEMGLRAGLGTSAIRKEPRPSEALQTAASAGTAFWKVCKLLKTWRPWTESNCRRQPFQGQLWRGWRCNDEATRSEKGRRRPIRAGCTVPTRETNWREAFHTPRMVYMVFPACQIYVALLAWA